jgi:hypothetical protein
MGGLMGDDWLRALRLLTGTGRAEDAYAAMGIGTGSARCLAHRLALAAEEVF